MKFGQLIEYNMMNIFFKKNYTQNVPYLKNQNWFYLWINSVKFKQFASIVSIPCSFSA